MATRGFASAGAGGVLAPIPLNLIPQSTATSALSAPPLPPSKKCKVSNPSAGSSSHGGCLSWEERIVIRPPTTSLTTRPLTLAPVTVLPRHSVPFSWIEYNTKGPEGWFSADIPVLEHNWDVVLVARVEDTASESDGGLVVVERVKRGVFVLLRIGRAVEGEVFVAGKGAQSASVSASGTGSEAGRKRARREVEGDVSSGDWWGAAKVEDPGLSAGGGSFLGKRGRGGGCGVEGVFGGAAVEVFGGSETQLQSQSQSVLHEMVRGSSSEGPVLLGVPEQSGGDVDDDYRVDALQSPQELLDGLRGQYLQALYVSKTSVAYFAKGPLARCRAAFQSENESSRPADLIEFYREAVLPAKRMDHKYRETLPSTIQDSLLVMSDDESAQPKKKRKSTKKKLGKNGLYPEEADFICKWWKGRTLNEQSVPSEVSREAESKKHIADLRLRETQLQILLILETMALETIMADEKKPDENGDGSADKPAKSSKAKKPQDLNVMLELHLDRLCIWHAVSFEETVVPDSAKTYGSNHLSGKKVESDTVRDFCTEVIVPFYASRLPDKCKLITRKLGVSTAISPFTKQAQTKKTTREPGTPVERQQAQKSRRRAFQRVLTDQATSQTRPSLSRSNTTPAQTESRRDSLDPLLPVLGSRVRGGIQKPKRVQNREVDLNAVARQHETKLKKMHLLVEQKKELDAAIHALRKPNRELVAKDIAEDADKRLTTGGSSRKPKNPVRNPLGQGVQVAATPKGSRKKDAIAGMPPVPKSLPHASSSLFQGFQGPSRSPFDSEPQMVPDSTARPSASFSGPFRSTDLGAIQETPTRRPTQPLLSGGMGASPSISGPLFRVPSKPTPTSAAAPVPGPVPAPRPTARGPITPIASRHVDPFLPRPNSIGHNTRPAMIMETPPKQAPGLGLGMDMAPAPAPIPVPVPHLQDTNSDPEVAVATETPVKATPARILATPVKNSARLGVPTTSAPPAVPVTPEKSIYAHLGWDDDDDDDDDLAIPKTGLAPKGISLMSQSLIPTATGTRVGKWGCLIDSPFTLHGYPERD
ncbi:hypothetical protein BO71DRAFT_442641 [Aspergillus ellipticus CBS 707.79]|uniref:DNA replication regulator Sld3 C-terminal domain-containing protein n=1 Tax=Aspergillus ellipticus CBS 707.79 TaxID=1448320 RepID=A0A319D4H1_9EURO|nr:hypothetical protein BO71DRAFT_442641 [Aspergillus ellipticus CBS 707.79]